MAPMSTDIAASGQESLKAASQNTKRDPLYEAMLGGQIGSTPIGSARLEPSAAGMDTLDEPVVETLVINTYHCEYYICL